MEKVALVIGHNARSRGGISEILGSEYDYWKKVATRIAELIPERVDVYERKKKNSYTEEMVEVLQKLNSKKYAYILELHFNCHDDDRPNGVEYLCHKKSKRGKEIGAAFLERISTEFGRKPRLKWYTYKWKQKDKATGKKVQRKKVAKEKGAIFISSDKQRGGFGICHTRDPYILLEPFYGTNMADAEAFQDIEKVAHAFACWIKGVE